MSPSLPLVLLACLFLYRAGAPSGSGITDPDYYWHVGYGEWILEHGRLPEADFWSWTFAGHPYRLTQWLGETLMAVAHQIAGETGTSTLAALLVTLTIGATYRACRYALDNRLAALSIAIFCNATLISLPCRPHQFTHLGLAVLAWILTAYQHGNRRALYWLPPLFALWVNLHGGYAFGLFYLGMAAVFSATGHYMSRDLPGLRVVSLPLFAVAGASLLATLINPYGIGAWQYVIEIGSLKSSSAGIVDEWAPTSIKTEAGLSFFLVVSALSAVMAASRKRPSAEQILSALALSAIGWSALRLSLMTTMLMAPLLAASLRESAFYDLAFAGQAQRFDRKIPLRAAFLAIALSVGAAILMRPSDRLATQRFMAGKLPVDAVAFMKKKRLTGRILNTPESGGYLIRRLGVKVSIDTRLDLYGDRALFDMLFARRGDHGWASYVDSLAPDIVLIDNPPALRHLLADGGKYRPVFEGSAYTVLVRQGFRTDLPTVPLTPTRLEFLNLLSS